MGVAVHGRADGVIRALGLQWGSGVLLCFRCWLGFRLCFRLCSGCGLWLWFCFCLRLRVSLRLRWYLRLCFCRVCFRLSVCFRLCGCFCLWLRLRLYRVRSSVCRDFVLGIAGCRGQAHSDRRTKHDGQCGDDWFSHLDTSLEAVAWIRSSPSMTACLKRSPP